MLAGLKDSDSVVKFGLKDWLWVVRLGVNELAFLLMV